MGRTLFSSLMLALTWLAWSGHFDARMLGLGGASVLVVLAITHRMERLSGMDHDPHVGPGILLYVPWLLWQIVKANVGMARILLAPRLLLSPQLLRVPTSQRSDTGRALYANSITLTPGTISLDLNNSSILVHALTLETAQALQDGEMDRRARRCEGRN